MEFGFLNTLARAPWAWAIVGLLPPAILALYFLKLKRVPLEVPSTYLWLKSIEDLHVNSIWQRLRKNLLLFLQLLLLALVILSLLRPGWSSTAKLNDRLIFLVDNSASMSATDVAPSRLEEAKRLVGERIDAMQPGDKAMIISFADGAQVVHEFSDNRRRLRSRLDEIQPTDETTSLLEALKLAAGLANPGRASFEDKDVQVAKEQPADVFLFTDGKFPTVEGFSLGNLKPTFVPIGAPGAANVGITAFNTRRHESKAGMLQAYAQLENHSDAETTVTAELFVNGVLDNADKVQLKPKGREGLVFPLADPGAAILRLEITPHDALAVDDVAYATINSARRGRVVLVTPGNDALKLALSTERALEIADIKVASPEHLTTEEYKGAALAGNYDLVIFDQCRPEAMPQANTLFIGRLPPTWPSADKPDKVEAPQVIDSNRSHPIMQLVDMENIDIAEGLTLKAPAGATMLVESNRGPLAAIAPREGFEDLVVGMEIIGTDASGAAYANTNWTLRPSFPTFVLNALQYFAGSNESLAAGSTRPGQPLKFRALSGAEKVEIASPAGNRETLEKGPDNEFQFSGTTKTGIYKVTEGKDQTQNFAVNLYDSSESDIAPKAKESIQIGYVEVAAQASWEPARSEFWKVLLGMALVVLVVEWYIYNRRVYI